jgi:alpha-L-fucosidase
MLSARFVRRLLIVALVIAVFPTARFVCAAPAAEGKESQEQRMAWWNEARFGMFIHWGLYAVPAGTWKGQQMPEIGEWIMSKYRIPIAEYSKLAEKFNPVKFDADQWVQTAKQAGMRYMLITAKHHDGFAMFDSKCDPYNIVRATPFHRDPMAELSAACQKHGLKFGFYYSQSLDWHERDAGGTEPGGSPNVGGMSWGNDWDFPNHSEKQYTRYFEKKVKPQMRELLTHYGPIAAIWFDCPFTLSRAQSEELYQMVRELQPQCLVNSRLGNGLGDYGSEGDNVIPAQGSAKYWETPATLNDTWGYKSFDHNWKSSETLIRNLVDIASKGGNYLLNVGPTAEGVMPEAGVKHLNDVGRWMQTNGESIYGTTASPLAKPLGWGRCTAKKLPDGVTRFYFHVFDWPKDGRLVLPVLQGKVVRASLLADPQHSPLAYQAGQGGLTVTVPSAQPDPCVSVVVLDMRP